MIVKHNNTFFGEDGISDLFIVRAVLGVLVWQSFKWMWRGVKQAYGGNVASGFVLTSLCQFHLPFYSSRTLPNTFALALAYVGYGFFLTNQPRKGIAVFIFSSLVIRCDVLVLLAPLAVWVWLFKENDVMVIITERVNVTTLLRSGFSLFFFGAGCFIVSLLMSVPLDYHLWLRKHIWPEGFVFYYNVFLNKSSNWGVSPFAWYFTSALPRSLLISFPFSFLGFYFADRTCRSLFICAVLFVFLYSFLPHKELRFIFPALPIFNLLSAIFVEKASSNRFVKYCIFALFLVCLVISSAFLLVSSRNYPGGFAMRQVNLQIMGEENSTGTRSGKPVNVHIDAYSAMNGISKFCYLKNRDVKTTYSKEENISALNLCDFSFLLRQGDVVVVSNVGECKFEKFSEISGEPKISTKFPFLVDRKDAIVIWKKKSLT